MDVDSWITTMALHGRRLSLIRRNRNTLKKRRCWWRDWWHCTVNSVCMLEGGDARYTSTREVASKRADDCTCRVIRKYRSDRWPLLYASASPSHTAALLIMSCLVFFLLLLFTFIMFLFIQYSHSSKFQTTLSHSFCSTIFLNFF